eukprot:TRINITY_DN65655_c0_g1_i1.p1 TRINITY_DN65655_c0_g1~~TRINITY_DN65655_c0_g1_i1.p1  ORF type:complete len:415 (+),score=99.74 TRINITY_DN65655_c0_g1_i1:76-1245(+)
MRPRAVRCGAEGVLRRWGPAALQCTAPAGARRCAQHQRRRVSEYAPLPPASSYSASPYRHALFVGGNGLPPGAYQPFLSLLGEQLPCPVTALDPHPCMVREDGSLEDSWGPMLCAVGQLAKSLAQDGPVLAIGHSLGAALLLACAAGSDTYPGGAFNVGAKLSFVVAIDPPLFRPRTRALIRGAVRLQRSSFWRMICATRKRTAQWESREAALQHLQGTRPWVQADPESLQAFCRYCLKDHPDGGVELSVPPAVEARVFECTPGELGIPLFPEPSDVGLYPPVVTGFTRAVAQASSGVGPGSRVSLFACTSGGWAPSRGHYLYSKRHEFSREDDIEWLRTQYRWLEFSPIGDHFFPLTEPDKAAEMVVDKAVPDLFAGEPRESQKIRPL